MRARAVLVAIWLAAMAATAQAQQARPDTDRMATATTLFEAGQQLVQEGRAPEACPKFEESYRLVAANGTLINLADCYEREGKTASAWLTFREVAQKSRADGQDARAEVAAERAVDLEPRLTRLLIAPGPNAGLAGLVVERDGVELGAAALGVPVPVDPGPHRIAARAPGHAPLSQEVSAEGDGQTVEIVLAALVPLSSIPAPPSTSRPWQAPLGITLFGIGGAGAIAGVVLGAVAKSQADGADCDDSNRCSPAGLDDRDGAVSLGNAGTGVGIAGAVLGGLGLTLWLTAPGDEAEATIVAEPAGASLRVRF